MGELPCDVRQGYLRDAILHSAGANIGHGLQHKTVARLRAEHLAKSPDTPRTVSRGGTVYPIDTGRIGRRQRESDPPAPERDPAPDEPAPEPSNPRSSASLPR